MLQLEPAGRTTTAALLPDGCVFATVGNSSEVRLWDTKTFRITRYFAGHQDCMRDVAFSRDGKTLISVASHEDRPGRLWDVESGVQAERTFAAGDALFQFQGKSSSMQCAG